MPFSFPQRVSRAFGFLAFAGLAIDLALRLGRPISTAHETFLLGLLTAGAGLAFFGALQARGAADPKVGGGRSGNPGPDSETDPGGMSQTYPFILHEIKNYVSTLKGNTQLLRMNLAGGGAEPSLQRLERATERIDKLSREVLDITLLSKPGEMRAVDLPSLIRNCSETYFNGLGVNFTLAADRTAPAILGEESKLEQVFLNLFKNSFEAGANQIGVSVFAQPGKVGILIEDNGKGCTPAEVERMFEAYQSFKRSQGGSGLGLFLVRAIIEGHGGTISGVSKTEKIEGASGMMFVLHFPVPAPQ